MVDNRETLRNRNYRTGRTALLAVPLAVTALGFSGVASASITGGAAPNLTPVAPGATAPTTIPRTSARVNSHGACPSIEKLRSAKKVSPACSGFLMRTIRKAGFSDIANKPAVKAYQSLAKVSGGADGALGPKTARSILKGTALHTTMPNSINTRQPSLLIDKSDQVAYLSYGKDKKVDIFTVSTGTEQAYSDVGDDGVLYSGIADTPTGNFKVGSEMSANYEAPLGPMPYAHFFTGNGHAVHSGNVSVGRASHGCVRVDSQTMPIIANTLRIGSPITVQE